LDGKITGRKRKGKPWEKKKIGWISQKQVAHFGSKTPSGGSDYEKGPRNCKKRHRKAVYLRTREGQRGQTTELKPAQSVKVTKSIRKGKKSPGRQICHKGVVGSYSTKRVHQENPECDIARGGKLSAMRLEKKTTVRDKKVKTVLKRPVTCRGSTKMGGGGGEPYFSRRKLVSQPKTEGKARTVVLRKSRKRNILQARSRKNK